jgi:hypothetical protein
MVNKLISVTTLKCETNFKVLLMLHIFVMLMLSTNCNVCYLRMMCGKIAIKFKIIVANSCVPFHKTNCHYSCKHSLHH